METRAARHQARRAAWNGISDGPDPRGTSGDRRTSQIPMGFLGKLFSSGETARPRAAGDGGELCWADLPARRTR